jgi:hypothetical protein
MAAAFAGRLHFVMARLGPIGAKMSVATVIGVVGLVSSPASHDQASLIMVREGDP